MILKNVASQGVYLYAVDTSASPYGPKTGDAANITGSVSLDGGARAAFGTANPTQLDATNMPGVYWQPLAQAETNGNAYAFSWKSSTSGVFVQPIFGFTSGINLPAVAAGSSGGLPKIGTSPFPASGTQAAAVWDEINTGATHNIANSTGKQLRSITVNASEVIYSSVLPSQAGMTTSQVKLDSGASAVDNAYQWDVFSAVAGTGQGSRICLSYVGATRVATLASAWTVAPLATDTVEITPTASVQVATYVASQDPATLVWAAATRTLTAGTNIVLAKGTGVTGFNDIAATSIVSGGAITTSGGAVSIVTTTTDLTNLPAITTDWITDAGVSAAAVSKIQSGLSTYAGGAVASVSGAVGSVAGNVGGNLLGSLTAAERNAIADAALVRDWNAVGSPADRSTFQALRFLRNKWSVVTGTLTVTEEDDATSAWTSTVSTDATARPIIGSDPA